MASLSCDCQDSCSSHVIRAPPTGSWSEAVMEFCWQQLGSVCWSALSVHCGHISVETGSYSPIFLPPYMCSWHGANISHTDPSIEIPGDRRHWTSGRFGQALKNWLATCTVVYLKNTTKPYIYCTT